MVWSRPSKSLHQSLRMRRKCERLSSSHRRYRLHTGFCVLETAVPTGDRVADAQKNLQLLREIKKQES
jgi:hypothetical protein